MRKKIKLSFKLFYIMISFQSRFFELCAVNITFVQIEDNFRSVAKLSKLKNKHYTVGTHKWYRTQIFLVTHGDEYLFEQETKWRSCTYFNDSLHFLHHKSDWLIPWYLVQVRTPTPWSSIWWRWCTRSPSHESGLYP